MVIRMSKEINTRTKKFRKLRQFILENIEGAFEVYLRNNPIEDGWLFSVYSRKRLFSVTVKVSYDTYIKHNDDWFRDMTLSEEGSALGGGWYGQELVLRPIGELLLKDI